jgi:hypothetical protein
MESLFYRNPPGRIVVPKPDGHTTGFQSTYHISTPDMSASTGYETRSNNAYAFLLLELDGVTRSIQRPSLGQVVAYFNFRSTKQINLIWYSAGIPLWQRNYYDHVIRNEEGYERIYAYIESNPVNRKDDDENPAR